MIKNFDEIKKQLSELSTVLNSFKSEAVQLKIVELIFGIPGEKVAPLPEGAVSKRKTRKKKISAESGQESKKKAKASPGGGAVSLLLKLYEEDFFKKPRAIGDLVNHADVNYAKKFKANEFSGKLARMVRVGQLERTKNKDGQYEYTKQ